ncbi:hypothetical protein GCM10027195_44260 [Comamonas sediminis]
MTWYGYDAQGRGTFVVNGAGEVQETVYDAAGRIARVTQYKQSISTVGLGDLASVGPAASGVDGRVRQRLVPGSGDATEYRIYSDDGWLTQTINALGESTTYVRDGAGNVIAQRNYANRVNTSTAAQWSSESGPTPAPDNARDQQSIFAYDLMGRMSYSTDGNGAATRFEYDRNGNLLKKTSYAQPINAAVGWSESNFATALAAQQTDPQNIVQRYTYDTANRLLNSIDGTGAVTSNVYDRNGNVVRVIRYAQALTGTATTPSASTRDMVQDRAYDNAGRLVYTVDAAGSVTRMAYDGNGNVVRQVQYAVTVTPPSSSSTQGAYTSSSLLAALASTENNADNRSTLRSYDAANRQVFVIDAEGGVTETAYAARSITTTRYAANVYADNWAVPVTPDAVRSQVWAQSGRDRVDVQRFDAAGRLTLSIDAEGYATRTTYDGLGQRVKTVVYAQAMAAGANEPVTSVGRDRETSYQYDRAGRLIITTDALQGREAYGYDGLGNRISFTNKAGSTWTYEYDKAGRMSAETQPDMVINRMTYDAWGRLTARTEASNRAEARTTRYEYDAAGRQVKTIFAAVGVYNEAVGNLTGNDATGYNPRAETTVSLFSETRYDALGNAIAGRDTAGNWSYKSYDNMGRVRYEVDAEGYVTGYARNQWGEVLTLTRYAERPTLSVAAGGNLAHATITQALASKNHTADRDILTSYDRNGRATKVQQPLVYNYDGQSGEEGLARKTTLNQYDAFGNLIATLDSLRNGQWATTSHAYDRLGQRVATTDALGYLTTMAYDATGSLTRRVEYSRQVPVGTAANAGLGDRIFDYQYDQLGRTTAQIRRAVSYSVYNGATTTATALTDQTKDLTTSYQYDALGNLTATIDATGGTTLSYYDALGRVIATVAPGTNTGAGAGGANNGAATRAAVTEYVRDALGNVTSTVQRANGDLIAAGTKLVQSATASADDHTTSNVYDALGRVSRTIDALGVVHNYSYDAMGRVAKQWQKVTINNDDRTQTTQTLLTAYAYDKLGHRSNVYTLKQNDLSTRNLTLVDSATEYNAFGEATVRSVKSGGVALAGGNEISEYDNAGRVWRSTAGDGVYKIMAYDQQGNQTVQLVGNGATSLAGIANAQTAITLQTLQPGEFRRTDMRYDALGHLTQTLAPERATGEASFISTREGTILATISQVEVLTQPVPLQPGAPVRINQVDLVWRSLKNLGSGDVRISLTYRSQAYEPPNTTGNDTDPNPLSPKSGLVKSIIVNAEQATDGYAFKWQSDRNVYGIEAVEAIKVEKLDLFGNWTTVYDVGAAAKQTTTLNWSEVASPGFVWSEPGPGRIPVYRLNKTLLDTHFFTARAPERDSLFNQGWLDEGVAFYISAAPATGLVPLYRLFNVGTNRCYYTSNAQDRANKLAAGWEDHGVEGYVGNSANAQPTGMTKLHVLQRNTTTGTAPDANAPDALYTVSPSDRNLLVGVTTPDNAARARPVTLYARENGLKIEVAYPLDIVSDTVLEWRPANSGAAWSRVPTSAQSTFGTAHQFDISKLNLAAGTYEYRVRQEKPGPTSSISQDVGSGVFSIKATSGASDPIPKLQGVAMGIASIDNNPWRVVSWPVPAPGSNVTFRYRLVNTTDWIVRTVGNGVFTEGDGRTTGMGAGRQGIALTMPAGTYEYEVIAAIGTNGSVQHAQGRLTVPSEVGAASVTSPQATVNPVNVTPPVTINNNGVTNTGIVGYVWTTPAAGRVALRRYLLPQSGNNHITTADPNVIAFFENSIASQQANGGVVTVVREGIVGYVQTSSNANNARLYQYSYSGDGATYRLSASTSRIGSYTALNSQPPASYSYTRGTWYQNSFQFDGYISTIPQEGTVPLYEVYNPKHISGAATIGDYMTSANAAEMSNSVNLNTTNLATATIAGIRVTPANLNGGNFPTLAWPAPEAGARTTVTASPAVPEFSSPIYVFKNGTSPEGHVVQYPSGVGQGIALHTLQPGATYTFEITIEYPATAQRSAYIARSTQRITVPAEGMKSVANTPVVNVTTTRANINYGSYPVLGWQAPAGMRTTVIATPAVPEFAVPLYVFKSGFVDGHLVQFPQGVNQGIALHTLKPGTSYIFEIIIENPTLAGMGASPTRSIVRIDVPASGMQSAGIVDTTLQYQAPTTIKLTSGVAPSARAAVAMQYDRWGNVIAVDDPRNAVTGQTWRTTYKYNAADQLIEQVRPQENTEGASTTLVRYDELGRQLAVRDGVGNWNITLHDAAGHLTSELHADGGRIDYRYSVFGEKVQSAERFDASRVVTTNYRYDRLSRLVQTDLEQAITATAVSNTAGADASNPSAIASDAENNVTVIRGNQTTLERVEYDEAGRRIRVVNGNSEATRYRYDAAGNLIRSAQETVYDTKGPYPVNPPAMAHVIEYRFDALGQKTWQMDANGTVQTWNWDRFGHLLSNTDQNISTTYQYNLAGQLARTIGQGSNKQNLAYRYDGAGQLIGIEDAAIGQVSTFSYDLAGNRVREKITQKTLQENGLLADVVYQDVRMVYDAQNQLRAVLNGHADVRIDYDTAGNRRRVQTRVRNTVNGTEYANDSTTNYLYDAMNRQTRATENGVVRDYTYDLAGNRTSERTTGSAEIIYTYDDVKRVVRSAQSGALTQNFYYDGAGRLAASESQITGQGGSTREWRYNRYDVLGQTQDSLIVTRDASSGSRKSTASVAYHDANGEIGLGYDAAGNLLGYTQNSNGTVQSTRYDNQHVMGNYVQASATTKQGGARVTLTTNRDANGFVSEISQATTGGSTKQDSAYYRAFVNDSAGNAVYINQGGGQQQIVQTQSGPMQGTVAASRLANPNSGWQGGWVGGALGAGHIQRQIVVQGQVIARYGDAPKLDVSMEGLNATGGTGSQPGSNSTPVTYANTVDVNLTAPGVNRGVGQQGVSLHTAQEGDTLQSIAQTRLGDSRLWYLIADANSLTVTGDAKLQAGQTLRIPSTTLNANRADTFEPWDPAKAIGSQQPNMPIPAAADGGCGGIGKIIMVVVAVVVSIYTAGAASALLSGSTFSTAMTAGSAAFSAGGLAGAGAGAFAIGGAAGSIASQLVGNAIGAQEGFSWKGVALSALGGAATAGMEQIGLGKLVAGNNATMGAAVQAAAANALTQGAAVVMGLQNSFDWKGVAASAVGAGVGKAVGGLLKDADVFVGLDPSLTKLAQGSVSGLAAGTAAALARGGKVAIQQVATDAFGNALGSSLADAIGQQSPTQESFRRTENAQAAAVQGYGPWSDLNYRNGSDIASDDPYYDRMTQQALARLGPEISDTATNAEILAYNLKTQGFGDDWSLDDAALKLNLGSALSGSGLKLGDNPFTYKSKLAYEVDADYSLSTDGLRLSSQVGAPSGWQSMLDGAKGAFNSLFINTGDLLYKAAGYLALSDPSVVYARSQDAKLSAEIAYQAATGMPGLSLPRLSYSTPIGPMAEGLTDFAQLALGGGLKLGVSAAAVLYSSDAQASPLTSLRKLIMPALGDSTQLVRMTNEGVAIVRNGDYAFSQIKLGNSTSFYRNELAKISELDPLVTNFRNAAQEVRDGYSFGRLSQSQKEFIEGARLKYPDQPWIAGYRESAARGSFVDAGIKDMLNKNLIPGGEIYHKMSVGPDLVPRNGVGLKMEITQYTPTLNAIVTHAWRYPNETMPYILYRTR